MEKTTAEKPQEEGREGGRKRIMARIRKNPRALAAIAVLALATISAAGAYWLISGSRIYIEKAEITAPIISLAPSAPGVIDKFYVREGERVHKNQPLAKIGDETLKARTSGIIISTTNNPGQTAGPQTPVITMMDPKEMRLVGRIAEDKGLSDIRPGQKAVFTVDAYGSAEYPATVETISPSARQSDIVFSISDKREEREFEVKATIDAATHPELRNGMSAKMWVYK